MFDTHPSNDMVSITLSKRADQDDYTVRSVEFISPALNHRSQPKKDLLIEQVFNEDLAVYMRQRLEHVRRRHMVESYPDDIVELQTATLGRTRLLSNLRANGNGNVIIRFAHFVGDFEGVFAFDAPLGRSAIKDGEVAMLKAIEAVHLPVINMADECVSRVLQDDQRRVIEDRLNKVSAEIDELRFYFHLLARHIANTDARPAAEIEFDGHITINDTYLR